MQLWLARDAAVPIREQAVVLEVSKDAQSSLRTTIEARIPKPTKRMPCGCGVER